MNHAHYDELREQEVGRRVERPPFAADHPGSERAQHRDRQDRDREVDQGGVLLGADQHQAEPGQQEQHHDGYTLSLVGCENSSGAARMPLNQARSTLVSTGVRSSWRSEEHTSELQSLMRISYAVF